MIFANDIRQAILKLAEERGTSHAFSPTEVAQAMDKDNWHTLTEQVKLVAGVLVQEGKLVFIKSDDAPKRDQTEGQLLRKR